MGLDKQDSTTANDNNDSATPDFGDPIDATKLDEKPSIDIDAINEAVMATGGSDPNIQNTFDVNDISLNDVPTSQQELDSRLSENPNMSLAGAGDAGTASSPADIPAGEKMGAIDMGVSPEEVAAKAEETPAASFVDGDITDESDKSADADAAADAALDAKANENPAHIANTITVPKPKSKLPIFIAVGVVAVIAIVGIVIFVITH